MSSVLQLLLISLTIVLSLSVLGRESYAEESSLFNGLRGEHPRILFTREMEKAMRPRLETDAFLQQVYQIVIREAEANLDDPVIEHKKKGKRLLDETRNSMSRIAYLSMAYRLTGEQKYLDRAEKEMLATSGLSDWNPSHFLDTAEMCAGLAIGYDWLFHELSEETKITIREAIVEKGFEAGFAEDYWWLSARNNWVQVCHGGLSLAALAVAEDEPEWAERVLGRALEKVLPTMEYLYAPHGTYPEGPGYWNYGTIYNVLLIAALETALGADFGLSHKQGFLESPYYHVFTIAPDGQYYRYSDCGGLRYVSASMYWFASKLDSPELAWLNCNAERHAFDRMTNSQRREDPGRFFPLILAWYSGKKQPDSTLPLDYFGQGPNPVAVFRSSWDDEDSLWLATKGGNNRNSHFHFDSGSFVVGAGGVRWSDDLGKDNYYNLEQTAQTLGRKIQRHEFFRLGVQGHSTLMLNNTQQKLDDSESPIIAFYSSPTRSHAIIDMSKPWRDQAREVLRGVAMLDKRSVLVQDEVEGASGEILWQMITVDGISIQDDRAFLESDGKRFIVKILSPGGLKFEVLSTKPKYQRERQNDGYAKLALRISEPEERTLIAVQMWLEEGEPPQPAQLTPLDEWGS